MRCLIVVRLSVETDATTSPKRQEEICREYAARKGWTVVGVARDLDVSAVKTRPEERPELGPWISRQTDMFDVILVWKLDRLVRSVADLGRLIEAGDRDGFAIVSATQPFDLTDAFGRAMAQIVAVFAELEAAMIRERVLSAIGDMRRTGRWPGGHVPFGYCPESLEGGGYRLVPVEEIAEVIREIAKRFLDGETWYSLATWLNDQGIPSPRDWRRIQIGKEPKGRPWHAGTLSQLMQSPVLLGYQMHNARPVTGKDGKRLAPQFPAILDEDTHRKLVAEARRRKGKRPQRRRAASRLLGVAFCFGCGTKLYHDRFGPATDKRDRYRCAKYPGRKEGCGLTISAAPLHAYVEREFLAVMGDMPVLVPVEDSGRDVAAELTDVNERLAEMRADRAAGLYRGDRGAAEYREAYMALEDERERLEVIPTKSSETQWVPTGRSVAETWADGDDDTRRDLLVLMGTRVAVKRAPRPGKLYAAEMEARFTFSVDGPAYWREDPLTATLADIAEREDAA